jgi:hypothetical protein
VRLTRSNVLLGVVGLLALWFLLGSINSSKQAAPPAPMPVIPIDVPPTTTPQQQPEDSLKRELEKIRQLIRAQTHLHFLFNIAEHERKIYCQLGEDGILEYIFDHIGTTNRRYVEFGVGDGTECTTRWLFERYGWDGLIMDGHHTVNVADSRPLRHHKATAENILELFEKYTVPLEFDLLTVDIDFNTYWLVKKIMESHYKPRVVIAEINRNFAPNESYAVTYDTARVHMDGYYGASTLAYYKLGKANGYTMVYVDRIAVNSFFIRNDVLMKYLAGKEKKEFVLEWEDVLTLVPPYEYSYRREKELHDDNWKQFLERFPSRPWVVV